jgi:hypothetical protein
MQRHVVAMPWVCSYKCETSSACTHENNHARVKNHAAPLVEEEPRGGNAEDALPRHHKLPRRHTLPGAYHNCVHARGKLGQLPPMLAHSTFGKHGV